MTRLQLLVSDWPSRAALLSTVAEVALTGRWEQVGVVARDRRVVWTENDEGVCLYYQPARGLAEAR